MNKADFQELKPKAPHYFFVPKGVKGVAEYNKGFSVKELFPINSNGIITARDDFTIHHTPQKLKESITKFRTMDDEAARHEFSLRQDGRDWKVNLARKDLEDNVFSNNKDKVIPIHYRPFDVRYTYYTGKAKGFHCYPRGKVMRHFIEGKNVGLILCRQFKGFKNYCHAFITREFFESGLVSNTPGEIGYGFPLYLYSNTASKI